MRDCGGAAAAGRWRYTLRRTEKEDKDDDELGGQEKDEER